MLVFEPMRVRAPLSYASNSHNADTSAASKYASMVGIGKPVVNVTTTANVVVKRPRMTFARLILIVVVCAATGGMVMELLMTRRSINNNTLTNPPPPPAAPAGNLRTTRDVEATLAAPLPPSDASRGDDGLPPLPPVIERRGPLPRLEVFVERLRTFLKPFTNEYTTTGKRTRIEPLAVDADVCVEGWSSPRKGRILEGCKLHRDSTFIFFDIL